MTQVRKGQAPATLSREEFGGRFRQLFFDPNFDREREALGRLEEIAWHNHEAERSRRGRARPTHWYSSSSALKRMIDRLVCADGGNPDPTSTHGKMVEEAKALELRGWPYPKHRAGRGYGLVVHGDVEGVDGNRRLLADWLDWMGLIDAGSRSRLGRYIGYWEPDATSHEALDRDQAIRDEARQVARAVARATREMRAGKIQAPLRRPQPRPK